MSWHCDTFATAAGPFSVAVDAEGAVVGAVFGDAGDLRARLPGERLSPDPGRCAAARREVQAYLVGERRGFTVRVGARGTPFQERVWAALQDIPWGETISYGELAARVGRPGAARAVGAANARNPVCLIVPCHRVIAADGSLQGYAWGTERKRWLLDLERFTPARDGRYSGA